MILQLFNSTFTLSHSPSAILCNPQVIDKAAPPIALGMEGSVHEVVEYAIEVYRHREMDELRLKVEVVDLAVVDVLGRELLADLHIRANIESMPLNFLPRFELKSRRVTRLL